ISRAASVSNLCHKRLAVRIFVGLAVVARTPSWALWAKGGAFDLTSPILFASLPNSFYRPASTPKETALQFPTRRFLAHPRGSPAPSTRDSANPPAYETAASQIAAFPPGTRPSSSENKNPHAKHFASFRSPHGCPRADP